MTAAGAETEGEREEKVDGSGGGAKVFFFPPLAHDLTINAPRLAREKT